MFEDETITIGCPQCSHIIPILVRDLEDSSEAHVTCGSCRAAVKVEAREFQQRLEVVRKELDEIQFEAKRGSKKFARRPRKGDFQI